MCGTFIGIAVDGKDPECPSNPKAKDGSCGPNIPILRKRGLTAAPAKPARENLRGILKDTAELLEAIDICLGIKPGNRPDDHSR